MKRLLSIAILMALVAALFVASSLRRTGEAIAEVERESDGASTGPIDARLADVAGGSGAPPPQRTAAPGAPGGAEDPPPRPAHLTLRIGPRPAETETGLGRYVGPQRLDEDDAPEWYVQQRGLWVSLSRREGPLRAEPAPFDGSAGAANEPLELRWEGVEDGVYDVRVELYGDAGVARTELTGIVVEAAGRSADRRLDVWDPMLDLAVMELDLELDLEWRSEAERFVIGVSEGETGRAIACPPRPTSEEIDRDGGGRVRRYGPYLVVHTSGRVATVHAFEALSGEVTVPFQPGPAVARLPGRITVGVQSESVPGAPDLRSDMFRLHRTTPTGEWRPPIQTMFLDGYGIPSGDRMAIVAVPASGDYVWRSEDRDWKSDPFHVERGSKNRTTIRMAPED